MTTYAQARQAYLVLTSQQALILRMLGRAEAVDVQLGPADLTEHAGQSVIASLEKAGLAQVADGDAYRITDQGRELYAARRTCWICKDSQVDPGGGDPCQCTTRAVDGQRG